MDCDEGRESRMCPTVKEEEFTTDVSLNSEGTGPTVGERRVCEAPPLGSLRVCDFDFWEETVVDLNPDLQEISQILL